MRDMNYYYNNEEIEKFTFFKMPKAFITDEKFKNLSNDAKLLYTLMLDRMSLSMKNNWVDKDGKIYISYKIDNIMKDLNCKKDKAILVLSELDDKFGVGLIHKVRMGFGLPNRIYLKKIDMSEKTNINENNDINNNSNKQNNENNDVSIVDNNVEKYVDNDVEKMCKTNKVGITDSISRFFKPHNEDKSTSLVGKSDTNKNIYNNNIYNNLNHINHDISKHEIKSENTKREDMIDSDVLSQYVELVKENIEYDHTMKFGKQEDLELYEELFQLICDVVCVKRDSIRVNGQNYPYELVKSKFLKLTSKHLNYVVRCMSNTKTKIYNIRSYMITSLFNAQNTIAHYWNQEVQYDMCCAKTC